MCLKQCAGMCFCLHVCVSAGTGRGMILSLRLSVLVHWAWHWPTFTTITLALPSCPLHRSCVTLWLFSVLECSTFAQIPNNQGIKWVQKKCRMCMQIHMCMSVYVPVGEQGSLFCIEKKSNSVKKKKKKIHLPFDNIMCLLPTKVANYNLFATFCQSLCILCTDPGHSSLWWANKHPYAFLEPSNQNIKCSCYATEDNTTRNPALYIKGYLCAL